MTPIYENEFIKIEIEESEIPWIKIFTQEKRKELSDCTEEEQLELLRVLTISEKLMLSFYKPKKINIASFGNYMPQVHWHLMARFEEDSYFPEPMWGEKRREGTYQLERFDEFLKLLKNNL